MGGSGWIWGDGWVMGGEMDEWDKERKKVKENKK